MSWSEDCDMNVLPCGRDGSARVMLTTPRHPALRQLSILTLMAASDGPGAKCDLSPPPPPTPPPPPPPPQSAPHSRSSHCLRVRVASAWKEQKGTVQITMLIMRRFAFFHSIDCYHFKRQPRKKPAKMKTMTGRFAWSRQTGVPAVRNLPWSDFRFTLNYC